MEYDCTHYLIVRCGAAATEVTNGRIKSGLHKVEVCDHLSRTTMWYEVCIWEQVPKSVRKQGKLIRDLTTPIVTSGIHFNSISFACLFVYNQAANQQINQ